MFILVFERGKFILLSKNFKETHLKNPFFSSGDEAINLEFPTPSYRPQKTTVLCTCKVMKKCIWTSVVRWIPGAFLSEISRCFFLPLKNGGVTKHWPFPTKYSNQQVNSTYGRVQEPLWYVLGNGWSLQSSIWEANRCNFIWFPILDLCGL